MHRIVWHAGTQSEYSPFELRFVFITAAGLLRLISDSDYLETIRSSNAPRTHLRLVNVWALLLGVLFISKLFLVTVSDPVVICVAAVIGLLSISMIIVHSPKRLSAT